MIENCDPATVEQVLEYFEQRFGLPKSLFEHFTFYAGPKGRVIVGPHNFDARLNPDTAGLLIARIGRSVKPTTNLLQIFGNQITRNYIELSRDQTLKYLTGLDLSITPEDRVDATGGYILVKYDSYALGCGSYHDNAIKNMLPRAKRMELEYL